MKAVIATDFTNRELVVRDATNEALDRVLDFGKKTAVLVIVPATLFLGILGYWGIKNFSDLRTKIDTAKSTADAATKDALAAKRVVDLTQNDISVVKRNITQTKTEVQTFETEINGDEQRMRSADRDVQRIEIEVGQLGSRKEQLNRVIDNLTSAAEQAGKRLSDKDVQKVNVAFNRS